MEHLLQSSSERPVVVRSAISRGLTGSIAAHLGLLAVALWFTYGRAQRHAPQPALDHDLQKLVWIAMPGRSGGGGGSPARVPPPPRPTPPQATRTPQPSAPVAVPEEIRPPAPSSEPQPPAPAVVADASSSGAATSPATAPGTGTGGGSGSGDGTGVGPGHDKGFGDGAYRPGNDVTSPVPTKRASPAYTAEAMRARAHGIITVECVVEPNGECGDVRIVRAFAPPFGLDQQALDAARRWRFKPGMRLGEPVPVLVNLDIEFAIY